MMAIRELVVNCMLNELCGLLWLEACEKNVSDGDADVNSQFLDSCVVRPAFD